MLTDMQRTLMMGSALVGMTDEREAAADAGDIVGTAQRRPSPGR